jgi:tetratricopeptide (TPR) repeat protein
MNSLEVKGMTISRFFCKVFSHGLNEFNEWARPNDYLSRPFVKFVQSVAKKLSACGYAALCFFIIASLFDAAPGYAADKWLSIQSKNFLLVGNASESAIRRVGRDLEEFRAAFAVIFPAVAQQASSPITVVVFKDDDSFKPFKPLYQGKPANIAGIFQAGQDINFIALTANTETPRVIYHEFVHFLTKDGTAPLPAWASEGIAELYSTFEIESNRKEMILGKPIGEHVQTLRQTILPVNSLFAVNRTSPLYNEQSKQGIFYAESWAVFHYLMLANNRQRQPQLIRFLNLLASGKGMDESFSEAFQTDYAKFESDIREYISHFAFPIIQLKLQTKIDFDREMQVTAIGEAQAQYYLGDFLLHIGRLDAAEAQLQKAVQLDPALAPGYASLGMLRMRQGNKTEALKYLSQAVQGDIRNSMVHYYYAFTLQSAVETKDKAQWQLMRDHLKKTIELTPDYFPAHDMLGYVALASGEGIPETEELLKKVLVSAPGKREIRIRLAELMLANKEPLAARAILFPLKNVSDDDTVQRRTETLLDQVQRQIDYEQALREYEVRRKEAETQAANIVKVPVPTNTTSTTNALEGPPTIRRSERTPAGTDSTTVETAKPTLNRPAGRQIEGTLLLVDCSNGMTLRVRVGNGNVELHSDDPSKIEFISYSKTVSDFIACGPLKTEVPVLIIYRTGGEARFLGVPLRVEFTGKQ